jgi:peroxiredoxin
MRRLVQGAPRLHPATHPIKENRAMNNRLKLAASAVIGMVIFTSPSYAALKVDTKAPDFSAPAYLAGQPFTFRLVDALKNGPVVVYFFPAAHTAGCNLEAHLFSDAIGQFKAQHATVIGVTAGNLNELADFSKETEHCGGKFPVAADPGAKIAKQYDAILSQKPEWSDRKSYVIASSGSIAHVYSDLNPKKHVKETLDAVKALGPKRSPPTSRQIRK